MITTNVIQRTFHTRYGGGTGTVFAIDRDGRQYLVTARHVVDGIQSGQTVEIFHERQWKQVPIELVGVGEGITDVAVLACHMPLAPTHPLEPSAAGLMFGQQVYFLGFPFGWDSGAENVNHEFPVPFVKTGFVSAIILGGHSQIYIDAHGNRGFSGGPVVFTPTGQPVNELHVAGVVAEAPRPLLRAVVDKSGNPLVGDDGNPIAYFPENQGFVLAFHIRHVTELIDANPVGFQLPAE